MRKITDFIVRCRYFFLIAFIIMAVAGLYLSTKVNINEDIMKYLPKTSETKIGKDIMDSDFAKQDTSTLNVMFKGLSNKEKEQTKKKLENIDGVSSVNFENNSEYNKGDYSLYILNVDDYADSELSTSVYKYVDDHFKTAGMSGSIYDENKPLLQIWIVVLAIACAMLILIILSDSFVEPWLYLISIGIAVFINKGTNIMFDSVSSITNSIVAILQLALSMDYSIMLSNRYKQEKEKNNNKIEAMKEALYHSFKAISSSSVTTVIGLLALVFMSFTIGRDLGYVLAKGVILSLLSIFFCLPALLLIFDNLILKTKKKSPKFNFTKIGGLVYKSRYVQAFLIIILFVIAYLVKGNINVLYTGSEQDKVGKVFPANNQIAIVYNNKYEDFFASYCKELEQDKKIDNVLCYSNTINEHLAYNELNNKIKDLGQDTNIDDYLIKIIYYNYFNKDNSKISLEDFISFIKNDIYGNDKFNDKISNETKDNLELLYNFTNNELINKERSIKSVAEILNISLEDASKIMIYYNSKRLNTTMTIKDFVNFMLNDILNDPEYSSNLDEKTVSSLKKLQLFTDGNKINKKLNSIELANMFGIDNNSIEQLLLFYRTNLDSNTKLTLKEFSDFALLLSREETYKSMFDENTINSLTLLNYLSDESTINQSLNPSSMMNILTNLGINLDENMVNMLFMLYDGNNTDTKITLSEFANILLSMKDNDTFKNYFDEEIVEQLNKIISLSNYANTSLPNNTLYSMFGISGEMGAKINYVFTGDVGGNYQLTPIEFVNTLLTNSMLSSQLNDEQISSLKSALYIMSNIDTKYSTSELSQVLNKDGNIVKLVYGMSDYNNGLLKNISVKEIINCLYDNRDNNLISNYISSSSDLLMLAYNIVNNTNTTYDYNEISNIINTDKEKVKKIYGVYDYNAYPTLLTPLELTNLILNNLDNELLSSKINSNMINELILVKEVMVSTINENKYTVLSISKLLGIDDNKISLLFSLYNSKYINEGSTISLYNFVDFVINDVMNNPEYSKNFDNEKQVKLTTIKKIVDNSINNVSYTASDSYEMLSRLSDSLDKSLIELVYIYYGSINEYDDSYKMTVEEFINYLNSDIITDPRFSDFIDKNKKNTIINSKKTIDKSKKLLVSDKYSRIVLNTQYPFESEDTYEFINSIYDKIDNKDDIYVVGNSSMAVEMSKTFNAELDKITLLTMIFIFIVVAITFKDLIIPFILVLIIQTAVYATMSVISISGGSVYFISLLIVQAILMGATIDYAIVYTAYYREMRLIMGVKDAIINAYNKSIHTIISSSTILIIVTLVVANFASAIAAKICETISEGTFASVILILFVLPGVLSSVDKLICRGNYYKEQNAKK